MNKLGIIIKREYLNIVKKKSFIISAILTPILMVGLIILPSLLAGVALVKEKKVAVVDETGYVFESLQQKQIYFSFIAEQTKQKDGVTSDSLEKMAKSQGLPGGQIGKLLREMSLKIIQSYAAMNFEKIDNISTTTENIKKIQLNRIRSKEIDVLLIIPKEVETDSKPAEYYSRSSGNFDETSLFRNFISEAVVSKRLSVAGMDSARVQQLTRPVPLSKSDVTETGVKKGSFLVTYFVGIAFVMLMFMAVMQTGQHLFRGVLEEKNNRIIEILLSSIKPKQLMSGKIIGLGAAGLTLVGIWATAGLLGLKISGGFGISIAPNTIVYFIIFFILGYLLYSTFMAILGAVMNSEQEAQHFITIISLSMMIPLFVAMIIVKHPNSTIATALTMFPVFTPSMIIFRLSITPVPPIEIALSIVILIVSIWIMISLTAKIFRIGILMYGKKPSLKEISRWIKYK